MKEISRAPLLTEDPREAKLLDALSSKPNNGKLLAKLSDFYTTVNPKDEEDSIRLRCQAMTCARKSIENAPNKPFGYTAMSLASRDPGERMSCLQRAILESTNNSVMDNKRFLVPSVGLMARLLIEGRDEQSKRVKGKTPRASSQHPDRSDLTPEEEALYKALRLALKRAWESSDESKTSFLLRIEYRLGLFFRKRLPNDKHQPRSRKHFRVCTERAPNDFSSLAGFWIGTLPCEEVDAAKQIQLSKCPEEYIIGLYSTFAAKFDELLVGKLHYTTPSKLLRLLRKVAPSLTFKRVADLGCGTGLSGLAFEEVLEEGGFIDGVDLSPEMLDQAGKRTKSDGKDRLYNRLVAGDINVLFEATNGKPAAFDLILACDVFVYLGDLAEVFRAASEVLAQSGGGYFCFSTEHLKQTNADYTLQSCARFAHSKAYIERLAHDSAFEVSRIEMASIRKNQGKDVQGLLVALSKTNAL